MALRQIISGGQTGVDRAALDAALAAGLPCGGWCPEGRLAEDGVIPARYPVEELPGSGYMERTRQNVADSDGTLIIAFGKPSGGTAGTIECCVQLLRPHLILDAQASTLDAAIAQVVQFLAAHDVARLNVAGPRASAEPRGYDYALAVVRGVLAAPP